MLKAFRDIGSWLQSLRGWIFALAALPAILTLVTSWLESLSWTERIIAVMAVLALSLTAACAAVVLFRLSGEYFSSQKEQRRIADQLNEVLASGVSDLDTPTIAAIWSGSRDDADVFRHLRFRTLKAAMRNGDIRWEKRPNETEPSIRSSVKVHDLVDYFLKKRVIQSTDLKK